MRSLCNQSRFNIQTVGEGGEWEVGERKRS